MWSEPSIPAAWHLTQSLFIKSHVNEIEHLFVEFFHDVGLIDLVLEGFSWYFNVAKNYYILRLDDLSWALIDNSVI